MALPGYDFRRIVNLSDSGNPEHLGTARVNQGSGVQNLMNSISSVQDEATSLFTEQIERQEQADRIRRVLTILGRFQSLFSLPMVSK